MLVHWRGSQLLMLSEGLMIKSVSELTATPFFFKKIFTPSSNLKVIY